MKTLGMIGGTSWHATIEYYRAINEGVAKEIGSQANPPLIIHSINIEVMRSQNKDRIIETYTDCAQKLESAGAEAIVICANTPHMVCKEVQPKIDIPFLHIARATGNEAQKLNLKKLGILGNKPTMTGNFIHNIIENEFNIDIIKPQGKSLEESHYFVSQELTHGKFTDEARSFYIGEIESFQNRGADGIILGCTELPILLKDVNHELPLLSTTHLHAQMAVDFILEK